MINKNGQIIPLEVVVYNQSNKTATGVLTTITLPYGLEYVSYIAPVGTFDPSKLRWIMFQLAPNTAKTLIINVRVKDINYAPFHVKQYVVANERDINMSNNCKTIVLEKALCERLPCDPSVPSDPTVIINDLGYSLYSGNLSLINNVDCGCCTAKYNLSNPNLPSPGNLVNFEIDFLNTATGEWRGRPLDPFESWSFDYQISCNACPDGQSFTYGPKTVSGEAFLSKPYYALGVCAPVKVELLPSTAYYYGNSLSDYTDTISGASRVYVLYDGTIKKINIVSYAVTPGTDEPFSMYIRINGTTSTLIATVSTLSNQRIFENLALDIPVSAGDYFEIIYTTPNFATNPEMFSWSGNVYIRQ